MPRNVSQNFKREVFSAQSGEAFILLLTLDHDDLENPICITPDPLEEISPGVRGVISNGTEFTALPFEIILPGEEEDSLPVSRVRMDNISREITAAIRSINSPAQATITVVLASDPDVEEISITGFELNNMRADALIVEGELNTERIDLRAFPPYRFTTSLFPGLH